MTDTRRQPGPEVDLTVVTMAFDSAPDADDRLRAVLARYVVLTRGHPGCRNVDLCASLTRPGRYVVVQKWETPDAERAHLDSPDMVAMAEACRELLARPPDMDLLAGISAHDLD